MTRERILRILLMIATFTLIGACGVLFVRVLQLRDAYKVMAFSSLQSIRIAQQLEQSRMRHLPSTNASTTTILFTGDIMLSRGVMSEVKKHGDDPTFPFVFIASTTRVADILVGNLESPISTRGTDQGNPYPFRADPMIIPGLQFAGFDVLTLANNHILDWGREALSDTVSRLNDASIRVSGAGRNESEANTPAIVQSKGMTFAIFSYTNLNSKSFFATGNSAGTSRFDEREIVTAVQNAKKEGKVVIVSMHWGDEYRSRANVAQQKLGKTFIDAGADIVVGHHPHVAEEVERYGNGWIAYSLGNFIFDQNFSEETNKGLLLEATVTRGRVTGVRLVPIRINTNFQAEPYEL
jgi:poly-gamma-glutamate capsule biosynthesis protein CapA/YwtB (metallophosphatase superfamily)